MWTALLVFILIIFGWSAFKCHQAHVANWGNRWLNTIDGLNRLFCKYIHGLEYNAPFALSEHQGAVVMANHSSGLDAMLLIATSPRPLRFLISHEQYERFGLQWFFRIIGCIPVNLKHKPERALKPALQALQNGEVIALFPQGGLTLPHESKKLKKGGFWLAEQAKCPIYPSIISGINGEGSIMGSIFFHRSQAKITTFPPIQCPDYKCLETLQPFFEKKMTWEQIKPSLIETTKTEQ
ncbi:lysophospholipid acyltransferase family protein [Candidatus Albibeggiatoa sp. nov. NOAA]|uniref:lysophospholipid acyltransferase family protein n=1 Tax=Candidatus Albibeggiatoa sp. nov. NOAA TaxID=3162724 RepID=UPI00330189F6|nr:1-acyl-sn-glycerol-3-phosphate acyltransferase [Thiotrichaceae bacterium]